jgi:hypothetical protein
MRLAPIVIALIVARAAHADPCAPPDPIDAAPRAMAVELVASQDGWTRTLAPTATSQFPAISEGGTVIVELFHDHEHDLVQPVATAVFFARGARAAAVSLASDATPTADRAQRRKERAAVAAINERLGRARWRPLAVAVPCADSNGMRAELGDGVHVQLRVYGEVVVGRDGGPDHAMSARFQVRGSTCARSIQLDRAFGTGGTRGFVVLVPRFDTDDGTCGGFTSAALAAAVPFD